jgi:D-glycero-D-manno-heptose 1,7-bisphosphate phosphatase
VIITNQSVVGRNIISLSQAMEINDRLIQEIRRAGGRIDGVYMCPHSPEQKCHCRKPKPGLIQQAAQEMNLDMPNSIMIGDAITDVQAGQNAGIEKTALVLTGRGQAQLSLTGMINLSPFRAYDNLMAASEAFIGRKMT